MTSSSFTRQKRHQKLGFSWSEGEEPPDVRGTHPAFRAGSPLGLLAPALPKSSAFAPISPEEDAYDSK